MNDHALTRALGVAVRQRRKELGLRQLELADLSGTSPRFVHMVEAGKPTVRLDKVLALLAVLGLSLQLVPGEGAIIPPQSPEGRP